MSNGITRWNPLREMATMQSMIDRLFEDWRPFVEDFPRTTNALALDVAEDDHSYTITTDLPGVNLEDIKVRKEGDYLLIEAETRRESETKDENKRFLIQERRFGHYSRRLRLPQNIDIEKADAQYADGVLTLTLPKTEDEVPRTITVKAAKK
jgi:HSP20 family protein